jgi:hypothetical protein
MKRTRIIVTGLIAQYPLGGVTWDYFQYVLGLKQLGYDVYYFEDTGQWPYNPVEKGTGQSCAYNVNYIAELMKRFGLENCWAYKFPWESEWFGMSAARRSETVSSSDLLINVSGSLANPERYREIPRMIYIDTDPVFTQIKLRKGLVEFDRQIRVHDVHFSFGESVADSFPDTDFEWKATRQPIVLSEWEPKPVAHGAYTTVMNWTSYKPLEYQGRSYAQKDVEFSRFIDLPDLVSNVSLEIAVNAGKTKRTPRELLVHKGWKLVDPEEVCPDLDSYRSYIEGSKAEWSVAKNGYVEGQAGWFSCRSACYLAAGKPVIVQDTGFENLFPVGKGLLSFTDIDGAVSAIEEVEGNYSEHSIVAREIAEQYFDSKKVLADLIE